MREKLKQTKIIIKDPIKNIYIFQEDYIFNSSSYTASAILGGNENGRRLWKYNGKI